MIIEHLTSPDAGNLFITEANHPTSHDAVARARKCNILFHISCFVDPVPTSFWIRGRQNVISTYKQKQIRLVTGFVKVLDHQLKKHFLRMVLIVCACVIRCSHYFILHALFKVGTPLCILYGSETGTTQELANRLASQARSRGYAVDLRELDEMDVDELALQENVLIMCATCGEGDFPVNATGFWEQISKDGAFGTDHLKNTRYAVWGMGDSSYHLFNETAIKIDQRMQDLGAQKSHDVGLGNDQDEDKYETALEEWLPEYWRLQNAPEPEGDHLIKAPMFDVQMIDADETMVQPYSPVMVPNSTLLRVVGVPRLTAEDYERTAVHVKFDISNCDVPFLLGDVLTVHPKNDSLKVSEFLKSNGLDPNQVVKVNALHAVDARRQMAYVDQRPLQQIFEEVVDILGRPNKGFYKELAKFASDKSEQAKLQLIASEDGKEHYQALSQETVTYAEVFRMSKKEYSFVSFHAWRLCFCCGREAAAVSNPNLKK